MPVIVQKTKMQNSQIRVVPSSNASVLAEEAVGKLADNIIASTYERASLNAKQAGQDKALSIDDTKIRAINADTGMPEALNSSELTGMGLIATNAYQDTINTQYEESVKTEINAMGQRASALFPDDPDGYSSEFTKNINAMKQHATGRYKNLMTRYGGSYLASTKIDKVKRALIKSNEVIKSNLIANNETKFGEIISAWGSNTSLDDLNKLNSIAKTTIQVAFGSGAINNQTRLDEIKKLNSAMTVGSLNRQVFDRTYTENGQEIFDESISGELTLKKLHVYLSAPTNSNLAKLDGHKIIVPETSFLDTQTNSIVKRPAMTMRQYAQYINQKIIIDGNSPQIIKYLGGKIALDKEMETLVNKETGNFNKSSGLILLNAQNKRIEEITEDFNNLNLERNSYIDGYTSEYKSKVNRIEIEHIQQTTNEIVSVINATQAMTVDVTGQGVTPPFTEKEVQKKFAPLMENFSRSVLASFTNKLNPKDRERALKTINTIAKSGAFRNRVQYKTLSQEDKKIITEQQYNTFLATHNEMAKINIPTLDFADIFEKHITSNSSVVSTLNVNVAKLESIELSDNRVMASLDLKKTTNTFKAQLMKEGVNVDFVDNPQELVNGVQSITNRMKPYRDNLANLKSKSLYTLKQLDSMEAELTTHYYAGVFSSLTSDIDKKYTFTTTVNGKSKSVERELTSKDIDRISQSIVYGSKAENNSFIPDEFKPLAVHMTTVKRLDATVSAQLIKELKSCYDSAKTETSKVNKRNEAITDISNRVDKKSDEIEKVMNEMIFEGELDIDGNPEPINVSWFKTTPINNENGEQNSKWEKAITNIKRYNRVPEEMVAWINALAKGNVNLPTDQMSQANKQRVNLNNNNAVSFFNLLKQIPVLEGGGGTRYRNFTKASTLVGHKFDKSAISNLEIAMGYAKYSNKSNGNSTVQTITKILQMNDPEMISQRNTQLFSKMADYYKSGNSVNLIEGGDQSSLKPTTPAHLILKVTTNDKLIKMMTPWVTSSINQGVFNNMESAQVIEAIQNKLMTDVLKPSSLVFSTENDGGVVIDGEYYAPNALGLEDDKIEIVKNYINTKLPSGKKMTNNIDDKNISSQTIADQKIQSQEYSSLNTLIDLADTTVLGAVKRGDLLVDAYNATKTFVNELNSGMAFKETDKDGDKPTYLVEVKGTDANPMFRVATIVSRNGAMEIKYVEGIDGPMEFSKKELQALGEEQSNLEPREQVKAEMAVIQDTVDRLSQIKLNGNTLSEDQKERLKEAKNDKLLKQKELDTFLEPVVAPSKNSTATVNDTIVDVKTSAFNLIAEQEDFKARKYKDGKDFSIGYGFYIPALSARHRAMFKNLNYVTEAESKIVLTEKIAEISKSWKSLVGGKHKGKWDNLPKKARVALISMGYQLGVTNFITNKGKGEWPKFMKAVRKASTFELGSDEQREALKDASNHMVNNYNDDNSIRGKTAWHMQTSDRADLMAKAVGGS